MDKNLVRRWINDLRYGGHEQAVGFLHKGDGFCCLGRAIEVIHGEDVWLIAPEMTATLGPIIYYPKMYKGEAAACAMQLAYADIDLLGINAILSRLIRMNDSGVPFKEIADFIEAELLPKTKRREYR